MLVAAGILDRLKGDSAHAIPGQRVADDVGNFAVVDAALHYRDQSRRQADGLERFERFAADPAELCSAQIDQRIVAEGIELEIDFEPRRVAREPLDELAVLGDAN